MRRINPFLPASLRSWCSIRVRVTPTRREARLQQSVLLPRCSGELGLSGLVEALAGPGTIMIHHLFYDAAGHTELGRQWFSCLSVLSSVERCFFSFPVTTSWVQLAVASSTQYSAVIYGQTNDLHLWLGVLSFPGSRNMLAVFFREHIA